MNLNCKKIDTAISRTKNLLIEKYNKNGLYENFGQKEVRLIEENFINSSVYTTEMNSNRDKLQIFNEWCMYFNG
jgi:hypothetical protein